MTEPSRHYVVLLGSVLFLILPFLGAEAAGDRLRIAAAVVAACLAVLWRTSSQQSGSADSRHWWRMAGWGALAAAGTVAILEGLRGAPSPEALSDEVGTAIVQGAIASVGMLSLVLLFRARLSEPIRDGFDPVAPSPVERLFWLRREVMLAAGAVLLALIGLAAVTSEAKVTGTWELINGPQFRFTVQETESGRIQGSGGAGTSTSGTSFDISGRRIGKSVSLVLRTGGGSRYGFEGTIVDEDWLYGTLYVEGRAPSTVQFHRR